MSLGSFIAGRYSATFDSSSVGIASRGYDLDFMFKSEAVDETDLYGASTIDLVLRGADVHIATELIEWLSGSKAMLWSLGGGALGKIYSAAVPAGMFAYDLAKALVLTATTNTTAAASGGPATLTASKTWPAQSFNPRVLFDSRLRRLPIRLLCIPYASGGDTLAFSTT